ncbi:hypothetical protein GCWU000341_02873 [Oribacterium sp. oral taxon 078 str. F0262]|nr:hypothetical protein GCWU000341_02873 [Oribacterium sp. oral taxon 078 str. F0262]
MESDFAAISKEDLPCLICVFLQFYISIKLCIMKISQVSIEKSQLPIQLFMH